MGTHRVVLNLPQEHNFCYIRDGVSAMCQIKTIRMSEHKETYTGARGGFTIYNYGFEIYYKMVPSSNATNQELQVTQLEEQMKKNQPAGQRILRRG